MRQSWPPAFVPQQATGGEGSEGNALLFSYHVAGDSWVESDGLHLAVSSDAGRTFVPLAGQEVVQHRNGGLLPRSVEADVALHLGPHIDLRLPLVANREDIRTSL